MLEAVFAVMVFDSLPLTLQTRVWLPDACIQKGKIVQALGHEPRKSAFRSFFVVWGSHQR